MAHSSNLLLASLSHGDIELLRPHLASVRLKQKDVLMEEGKHVRAVYFPTNSVISLVVTLQNGRVVESAMVGRDGVLAASPALDSRLSLSRAVVQLAGMRWSAKRLVSKRPCSKVRRCYPLSCGMSRHFTRNPNNRRPACPLTLSRTGCVDFFSARGTYVGRTNSLSRKNS
jgi:hypothetical protein